MSIGFWQVIIIAVVVVLLFGSGKISDLMGDVAKGIKSFRKGLQDDDDEPPKVITSERRESQPQKTEQRE